MRNRMSPWLAAVMLLALNATPAPAEQGEDFARWAPLSNPFESTGGGGVMIDGYDPVVRDRHCTTAFTATTPDGTVFRNEVEFDALPTQGGILCTNGRWRALDGSASGTTPFRVFILEGRRLRSP